MGKGKLVLGWVHGDDSVSPYFMNSVIRLIRSEGQRIEEVITVRSGPKVDDSRNRLFKEWLTRSEASRILMLDTDLIFPPNTIRRLVSHNLDIVSGLYFTRAFGGMTRPNIHIVGEDGVMRIMYDYPRDQLVEVDGTGAGCMMVARHAAERIWEARGEEHPMPWFAFGMHNGLPIGEDVAFVLTAMKCGFKTYVDTGLVLPHAKIVPVGEYEYLQSLMDESHPYYTQRHEVPLYQELVDGNASLGGDQPSIEEVPGARTG